MHIIMGRTPLGNFASFSLDDVKNKNLIIDMLKFEDTLIHGEIGQKIYGNFLYKPHVSLFPEYHIHRLVLSNFGFTTFEEDVKNYRSIFRYYYRNPDDYDKEVISSVTYMRENKCIYYKQPVLNIGDHLPNCRIYELDGHTETSLYNKLGTDFRYMFIGGFSNS